MKLTKLQLEQIIREKTLNFNSTSLLEGWFGAGDEPEIDVDSYKIMNQLINHTKDQYVMMDRMKQRIEELELQMLEISSQIDVSSPVPPKEDTDPTRNIRTPKNIEEIIKEEFKKALEEV